MISGAGVHTVWPPVVRVHQASQFHIFIGIPIEEVAYPRNAAVCILFLSLLHRADRPNPDLKEAMCIDSLLGCGRIGIPGWE